MRSKPPFLFLADSYKKIEVIEQQINTEAKTYVAPDMTPINMITINYLIKESKRTCNNDNLYYIYLLVFITSI